MTILFLALWLQMSASTTGISHLGSVTVDHGKVVSTQIACIKTYADGFIDYVPCETPMITNTVQLAGEVTVSEEELKREAQMAADETDVKAPKTITTVCFDCKPYIPAAPTITPERVDVPAVQVGEQLSYDCGQGIACIDHYVPVYSCKDKSRILEHDENSPAKYWCRKVEF